MNIFLITLATIFLGIILFQLLLIKRLAVDVVIDKQTGLKNYLWFEKKISNLISKRKSKNQQTSFSIAIIDIDNFRRFNKQGLHVGDHVLNEFSDKLYELVFKIANTKNIVRYRLGDEFAIIFENITHDQVTEFMKIISNTFKENFIKIPSSTDLIYITFGYGLATINDQDSCESFIQRAELDLVQNKMKEK